MEGEFEVVTFALEDDKFTYDTCGNEHLVLMTENGRVYTYGHGSKGQLGHGNVDNELEEAKLVEALDGNRIVKVAAGGWHSMAIAETGDLYAFGWNESGQLGFSKSQLPLTATPLLVEACDDVNWSVVSCGSSHTMEVTSDGQVFGFGWNKYGQLGVSSKDTPSADKPTQVQLDGDKKAVNVSCKYWSTIIECGKP